MVGACYSRACILSIGDHRPLQGFCDSRRERWVSRTTMSTWGMDKPRRSWTSLRTFRKSQAPSRSCSCANSSCTHFSLRIALGGWKNGRQASQCQIRIFAHVTEARTPLSRSRFHSHAHNTHTISFQDIKSGQGHPPLLPVPDTTVTGGSSIPKFAVLPLTSGLQDKRERTGIFKLVDQL